MKDRMAQLDKLEPTEEQEEAIKVMVCRRPLLLTGPSGSGKNFTLNAGAKYLEEDGIRVARCSFAGAAVESINGTTLHSFFKLPLSLIQNGALAAPNIDKLMNTDVLMVNYIHVCTPLIIDIIWNAVEMAKDRGHYVQVVFSGDPLSLGSVMDYETKTQYKEIIKPFPLSDSPFLSRHWVDFGFEIVNLTKDLVRGDTPFGLALQEIRYGNPNGLNRLYPLLSSSPIKDAVWVFGTRHEVQKKNKEALEALPGKMITFGATISGNVKGDDRFSPECLELKVNAPVIVTFSLPQKGLAKGTIGKVIGFAKNGVYVHFPGRKGRLLIEPFCNETLSGGSFTQLPLDLAFAITAFKARYLNLDAVNTTSSSFRNNAQLYAVANRVRLPQKLFIMGNLSRKQITIDHRVWKWYTSHVTREAPTPASILPAYEYVPYGTINGLRYAAFTSNEGGNPRTHICLRHVTSKLICGYTNFAKYAKPASRMRAAKSDIGDAIYYITTFLNYCRIDAPNTANTVLEITADHIKGFLNAYGMGCYGRGDASHTKGTTEKCVNYVLRFLQELLADPTLNLSFSLSDLLKTNFAWSSTRGVYEKKVLTFEIIYEDDEHVCLRDMPPEVVQEMLAIAYEEFPDILICLALGICAGLRPSEAIVLALYGIKVRRRGKKITSVTIDLEHTPPLRPDGVVTGSVKKPRIVTMEKMFFDLFAPLYDRYMEWRNVQNADPSYQPLCVDSNGNAMTYDTLLRRFKRLMEVTEERLRSSTNERVQDFLTDYRKYGCSCHICRHVFTVNLVLAGYDEVGIMNARGDKNVTSAQHYLKNKGIICDRANANVTALAAMILEVAKRMKAKRSKGGKK